MAENKNSKKEAKSNMKKSKEHMEKSKEELKKSIDELEKELRDSAGDLRAKSEERYNRVITRLDKERKNMQHMMAEDYQEARRYVSSNPEEGLAFAFAGGLVLGLCLGIMRR